MSIVPVRESPPLPSRDPWGPHLGYVIRHNSDRGHDTLSNLSNP